MINALDKQNKTSTQRIHVLFSATFIIPKRTAKNPHHSYNKFNVYAKENNL